MDATEFDSYVKAHLGSTLYSPADLLTKSDGTLYPNLDAAAQADNWGTYGSLEGKVIVEIIPGTVEQAVEPSSTWVDVVYAQHLLDLYNSGEHRGRGGLPVRARRAGRRPPRPVQRHRAAPVVRRIRR